jgi:hypothetical protein
MLLWLCSLAGASGSDRIGQDQGAVRLLAATTASRNLQHAACNMYNAACNMYNAACNMYNAACDTYNASL